MHDASTLASAAKWIGAVAQGPLAASLAVLAVAGVGFAMLRGRLSVRRGGMVVFGSFIMFGAPSIAAAMMRLVHENSSVEPITQQVEPPVRPDPPATAATDVDPYAGASVPN